tara:strand:- start:410 stop:556 length:147 start_codon:yes stop_codon:yes gene_type:complete
MIKPLKRQEDKNKNKKKSKPGPGAKFFNMLKCSKIGLKTLLHKQIKTI